MNMRKFLSVATGAIVVLAAVLSVSLASPTPAEGQNPFNLPLRARVKSTQPALWLRQSNANGGIVLAERVPTMVGTPGVKGTPTAVFVIANNGDTMFDGAVQFNGSVTGGAVTNDLNGGAFYLDPNQSAILRAQTNGRTTVTLPATGTLQITTGSFRVGNGSNGTALNGEDAYVEGTFEVDAAAKLDGGVTTTTITGANAETLNNATNGFWDLGTAGLMQTANTANGIGFESVISAAVITSTNATLWTVPASQKWLVKRVFCHVTTNFDCSGDDCQVIIGDDTDTDGFLVLADATLQTADTEGTGWPAGWQGFATGTVGAFLDGGGWSFPYVATQTIDIDIRDVSGGGNPTAGAATCYLDYMRFE